MRRTLMRMLAAAAPILALAAPAFAAEAAPVDVFPHLKLMPLTMALFVIVIFPANRFLFQPILRVLDSRRERIDGAREEAQRVSKEAAEILSRHEEVVQRARREADAERRGKLDEARQQHVRLTADARGEADQETARARQEVSTALAEARVKLREQSERLGREAAARVLGRELP